MPHNPRVFQVDLIKRAERATVSSSVAEDALTVADLMRRLFARPNRGLKGFAQAFYDRYGEREIPLTAALDEDIGIGYSQTDEGRSRDDRVDTASWHRFLIEAYLSVIRSGASELAFDQHQLEPFCDHIAPPLPPSFCIVASIGASSEEAINRGAFEIHLKGLWGPPGAGWLTRFCHADPALCLGLLQLAQSMHRIHL